jgi:hypothetical protein
MSVQPSKGLYPGNQSQNLKTKFSLAEFLDELRGSGWDLGVPLADIKKINEGMG